MSSRWVKPNARSVSTAAWSAPGRIAASSMSSSDAASRKASPAAFSSAGMRPADVARSGCGWTVSGTRDEHLAFASGLDLLPDLHDAVDERIRTRRATRHVDVDRQERVARHDRVVVEDAAAARA